MKKEEALKLVKQANNCVTAEFLNLASTLTKVKAGLGSQDDFRWVCEKAGIGYRKGYYLLSIDTMAANVASPSLLLEVGWTKLSILASAEVIGASPNSDMAWIEYARKNTVQALKTKLAGTGTVELWGLLYLPPEYKAKLNNILLAHGADVSSGRMRNKTLAMQRFIDAAVQMGALVE